METSPLHTAFMPCFFSSFCLLLTLNMFSFFSPHDSLTGCLLPQPVWNPTLTVRFRSSSLSLELHFESLKLSLLPINGSVTLKCICFGIKIFAQRVICALLSRKGKTDCSVNSDFSTVFFCLWLLTWWVLVTWQGDWEQGGSLSLLATVSFYACPLILTEQT